MHVFHAIGNLISNVHEFICTRLTVALFGPEHQSTTNESPSLRSPFKFNSHFIFITIAVLLLVIFYCYCPT
ncbi:hypothetical protein BpHYR1_024349 [Brachionus plicatilis]|uniref:Uncharacterized protein n=1 Tax=Brachionus plicatilis TaxID=10195 RepID=A0A3M7RZQ1_BRAPC|nr:hypothetical protein BpHYR1_024349 [Brachionus plicatilis]